MRARFTYPSQQQLEAYLAGKKTALFNYTPILGTQQVSVQGFDNDHSSILLGQGEQVWEKAKMTLLNWQQFPISWTKVYNDKTPLEEGQTVIVLFRLFGIWWLNATRIVYTLDEPDRFGFAYGTVEGHVESGEECFWIERDEKGDIYYHIKAFSKPDFWLARLGYPMARRYQKKFVRDSMERIRNYCNE